MINRVSHKRWLFAQQNELEYQKRKAIQLAAAMQSVDTLARSNSESVSAYLSNLGVFSGDGLTVEVGSGASGLIWHWPGKNRIAIDPLAHFFRMSFDKIQSNGPHIIQARGEGLPLPDHCADTVLSDNVLDHVENPLAYLVECRRILKPGGVFYLTIDVHHPIYWSIGRFYNLLFGLGLRLKVPAFPHHPFHFTADRVTRLVDEAGLQRLTPLRGTRQPAPWRGESLAGRLINKIQSVFAKNIRLEMVLKI